jgi:hypothetical protein
MELQETASAQLDQLGAKATCPRVSWAFQSVSAPSQSASGAQSQLSLSRSICLGNCAIYRQLTDRRGAYREAGKGEIALQKRIWLREKRKEDQERAREILRIYRYRARERD